MDEASAELSCEEAKHEVARKEEESMAAGLGGSASGPPPRFALKRTLPWKIANHPVMPARSEPSPANETMVECLTKLEQARRLWFPNQLQPRVRPMRFCKSLPQPLLRPIRFCMSQPQPLVR